MAASLVVGVGIAEFVLRQIRIAPHYKMPGLVLELDPTVLYRVRPRSGPEINSLGYRDKEFDVEKGDRRRVLMLGDSFVMGGNVPIEATLPKALERALGEGHEVLNMGVYGYGPDQEYLRLLEDGLRLRPDVVVVVLFPANDFNDLKKNGLFRIDERGDLATGRKNAVDAVLPALRSTLLVRKLATGRFLTREQEERLFQRLLVDRYDLLRDRASPQASEKIALMRGVLRRMRDALSERKVPLAALIVPSYQNIVDDSEFRQAGVPREDYFNNEEIAAAICSEEGIPTVSLERPFRDLRHEVLFDPSDHHLNAHGNERAAALLADMVRLFARSS